MGFIDSDEADRESAQETLESWQCEALRRYVENFELTALGLGLHSGDFPGIKGAVDELSRNAVGFQGINLVFHQGD